MLRSAVKRIEGGGNVSTPFFIYFEEAVSGGIDKFFYITAEIGGKIFYSVKTNYLAPLVKIIKSKGCGVEVSSLKELEIVIDAGYNGREIIADGFFKNDSYLKRAVSEGVYLINCESVSEIIRVNDIAASLGRVQDIGIRLFYKPKRFNLKNSLIKFFIPYFDNFGIYSVLNKSFVEFLRFGDNVRLVSLMVHSVSPYYEPSEIIDIAKILKKNYEFFLEKGVDIKSLNFGGGFPGHMVSIEKSKKYIKKAKEILDPILNDVEILFEPGRFIVEESAFLVGRVLDIRGKYLITDISKGNFGYEFPFKKNIVFDICDTKDNGKRWNIKSWNLSPYDIMKGSYKLSRGIKAGDYIVFSGLGAYAEHFSYDFGAYGAIRYFFYKNGAFLEF